MNRDRIHAVRGVEQTLGTEPASPGLLTKIARVQIIVEFADGTKGCVDARDVLSGSIVFRDERSVTGVIGARLVMSADTEMVAKFLIRDFIVANVMEDDSTTGTTS